MILNRQQKEEIQKNVAKIENMGGQQLEAFAQKWHMAKEDLDPSVFSWILGVMDDKQAEFKKQKAFGHHEAVASELREGEVC